MPLAPIEAPVVEEDKKIDKKKKHAPQYKVLLHNDNVTPFEFVTHILFTVFKKKEQDAVNIMLMAHRSGVALVGIYPLEEAEFRLEQAKALIAAQKYPLTLTIEEA